MRRNVGKKGFRKETKHCTSLNEGTNWGCECLGSREGHSNRKEKRNKLKTYRINHWDGYKKGIDRLKCEIKLRKARFNQDK